VVEVTEGKRTRLQNGTAGPQPKVAQAAPATASKRDPQVPRWQVPGATIKGTGKFA